MRIKMKSVISALLASVMLIGTIPAVTYAAQVNEYNDPADNWLKANGRPNELDVNTTTTYQPGSSSVRQRASLALTERATAFPQSDEPASNRGVK